ncbi:MAG: aminopeptidase P N-terminal domain-containing protein [Lysobacterales bacterium]
MIASPEFARRRAQLMRIAGNDSILIVPSAPERVRSNDSMYPYRQDSDFHYLCGFPEPHAVIALVPGRTAGAAILFCRERDADRERWDGPRAGPEGATRVHGFDDAFPIDDIDDILPGLIEGRRRVHYPLGRDPDFDARLLGWIKRVRADVKQGAQPPHELAELGHLLHEMRLFKSRAELALMRKAARISAAAHVRGARLARAGESETTVAAAILHEFHHAGAVAAYEPIVGGGANACVLHYRANRDPLRDGDLLLVDAGAELEGYASDISRTWPVGGRYSREQRALYEVVLAAQLAAIECVVAGAAWDFPHNAAVTVLTQGLIDLKLLRGDLAGNIERGDYRRFYMHKTGHWLGLDVHDVGDYRIDGEFRQLEPGMVLTIEPGLYIAPDMPGVAARWRGLGIRIEDDVAVTRNGPDVLSRDAPKAIDEIERLLAA